MTSATPFQLDVALTPDRFDLLRRGALAVVTEPAVFRIEGPGALQCLQGLLTNDLAQPGEQSLVYGALLTPKGMIVVDYWVLRLASAFLLVAPRHAHQASLDLFTRSLPPRLARVTDLTGSWRALWCLGSETIRTLERSGIAPLPEGAARAVTIDDAEDSALPGALAGALAFAPEGAFFGALALGGPETIERLAARLHAAGAVDGSAADIEAARILAGWPALGAEIDEKTLPQEVRYDEIGGVSYTKGCYTGQETVARLHFRGRANRSLRGLDWQGAEPLDDRTIVAEGKDVGTVRSTLVVGDRRIGLAPVRREVETGAKVVAGGRPATVVGLPFAADDPA